MKLDSLYRNLGTDTTTAIQMFLTQVVEMNGLQLEIKRQVVVDSHVAIAEEEGLDDLGVYLMLEKKSDQAAKKLLED